MPRDAGLAPYVLWLRVLLLALGLVGAILVVAALQQLGALLMKRLPAVLALSVATLALAGCLSGIPKEDRSVVLKGAAEHIEKCDRHYWANTGLGASAGFDVNCKPTAENLAATIAAAVKQAVSDALQGNVATPPAEAP